MNERFPGIFLYNAEPRYSIGGYLGNCMQSA